jgi:methionyl-tRNA formyltransferase
MRIEFLTQKDPLYILPFFDEFVRAYGSEFEITQISGCRAMGKRSRAKLLKELWFLYGTSGLLRLMGRVAASEALALLRSSNIARYFTIAQLCRARAIPYQQIGNPNSSEFVQKVKSRRPDLIISIACPYILKEDLLRLPRLGCINLHHAPLPRYKGMMPTFWQMYHGETHVGLTIHRMATNIDEGEILFQTELQIESGESLDTLIRRSKRHAAHCLGSVLKQIASDQQTVIGRQHAASSYFTFPTLGEIREFRRRGLRAI